MIVCETQRLRLRHLLDTDAPFILELLNEPDFIRIFLQFSVGIHHAKMGQWRPAVERIEEGLLLVSANQDDRGIDLAGLANQMKGGVRSVRSRSKPVWPVIVFS